MPEDLPALPKLLRYFEDNQKAREGELLRNFADKAPIKAALSTLVEKGVLLKNEDSYTKGPHFEPTHRRMREVYESVAELDREREKREWIMRGLLIEVSAFSTETLLSSGYLPPAKRLPTLYRLDRVLLPLTLVYATFPFERPLVEEFLRRETKRKFVKIIRVLGRAVPPSTLYLRSPYRFNAGLRALSAEEMDEVKRSWEGSGAKVYEEKFLFGYYPNDLVEKARGYLSSRNDLTSELREKFHVYLHR